MFETSRISGWPGNRYFLTIWTSSSPKRRLKSMCRSFERFWPRKNTTMCSWNSRSISRKLASSIGPDRSNASSAPQAASHRRTGIVMSAGTRVSRAVLEDVRLAVDRKDDRTLVGMGFVERSDPPPNEFAGAADPLVVVERTLDDIGLLDLRVLVHRQGRPRFPFQEAGQLALRLVFVEHLDRDAVELRRPPSDFLRLDVNRAVHRGLHGRLPGCCGRFLHRLGHAGFPFSCG